MKFSLHIANISRKAHKRANNHSLFPFNNIQSLVASYTVYVRPILEYSSVAWNPYLIKDIKALESVQRRFTKRLLGMEKLTYHQRLRILELDSLELRRVRADLLFSYKLVFSLIDASLHDFSYHASTKLDKVTTINCTFQPAKHTQNLIVSTTESYKNGTHSQIALILHHLKDFINLWQLKCYFHIARYFLFSWLCCV